MGAENTVKGILAVVRDPGELSAVIIQKTRSKADPAACGDMENHFNNREMPLQTAGVWDLITF